MPEHISKERAIQLVIENCNKYHFADDAMLECIAAIEKEPTDDSAQVRYSHWEAIRDPYGEVEGFIISGRRPPPQGA